MTKGRYLLKFAALLALILTPNCYAFAVEFDPAETPVKVEVLAKASYLPGLPIRVNIEVTNVSKQTVETLKPSLKFGTIYAILKREGDKTYLDQTRHQINVVFAYQNFMLKPGETTLGQLDLSMLFQDDLQPVRYLCEAYYACGKSFPTSHLIGSKPISIVIEEPKGITGGEQRDLDVSKTIFLGARALLSENNEESDAIAQKTFSYLNSQDRISEYGKISGYYKASLEKDPKRALPNWLDYMENPGTDAPDLMDSDDIWLIVGRLYHETGNFKAAREALLKIRKPDAVAKELMVP